MVDDSMLCLGGLLILVPIFITWYRSGDSLVSLPGSSSLRASADRAFWGYKLKSIPTLGFSDPVLSYLSAFHYDVFGGATLIKKGYEKVMQMK